MKNIFRFAGIILILIFNLSCKKVKTILLPVVSTSPVTEILYTTATCGGIIEDDGGGSVNVGVCWGTNPGPTTADNKTYEGTPSGKFVSSISGLKPGSLYHVRAYATNITGTVYGDDVSFTTKVFEVNYNSGLTYGTVTDIDGKSYKTIQIGIQLWLAENLKTSKFNDGSSIPLITDYAQWTNIVTPGYCWFDNNDTLYKKIYGAYYNWFAVNTGKLCPTGWHVPSESDWQILVDFLGGDNNAGANLKEMGTNNWVLSNKDATNATGFTALPAGGRAAQDGTFTGQGYYGGWWSTAEFNTSPLGVAWSWWVIGDSTAVFHSEIFKKNGFSVRCLKD